MRKLFSYVLTFLPTHLVKVFQVELSHENWFSYNIIMMMIAFVINHHQNNQQRTKKYHK